MAESSSPCIRTIRTGQSALKRSCSRQAPRISRQPQKPAPTTPRAIGRSLAPLRAMMRCPFPQEGRQPSWINRPTSTSVNSAANQSLRRLSCASMKKPAKTLQRQRRAAAPPLRDGFERSGQKVLFLITGNGLVINMPAARLDSEQYEKEESVMKGFVQDIEDLAIKNEEFRRVLYTAKHCQLVVMALKPKEEIGAEVHKLDQFFRVEQGTGEAVLDGVRTGIRAGFAVVVPVGTNHNIINTGSVPLKLYTLYAPPNHRDGVVHRTRAEAEKDDEHFDGKTTE